jgi:hypothetical protein
LNDDDDSNNNNDDDDDDDDNINNTGDCNVIIVQALLFDNNIRYL